MRKRAAIFFLVWICHGMLLEHVVGFNALVDVGVSWSLIFPSLRCIADGTFLKTFCADRFSLVFFWQGRCFCLTMAVGRFIKLYCVVFVLHAVYACRRTQ